jgi:hypothetical protein
MHHYGHDPHDKRRRRRMRVEDESGLEVRVGEAVPAVEDTPINRISGQEGSYDHAEVTVTLGKARYCDPRRDYPRVIGTSNREELRDLGHKLKDENPMLANDIFTYTGDREGVEEMKERLFNSVNPQELSYAFFWAQEQGSEVLEEYCETLLRNRSDPARAFGVSEMIGNVRLARLAYIQLLKVDPVAAAKIRSRYDELRKTPTPSKAIKAVRIDSKGSSKRN